MTSNGDLTACKRGHPFDEENTRYTKHACGAVHRICRTCTRDRAKAKQPERNRKVRIMAKVLRTHSDDWIATDAILPGKGSLAARARAIMSELRTLRIKA